MTNMTWDECEARLAEWAQLEQWEGAPAPEDLEVARNYIKNWQNVSVPPSTMYLDGFGGIDFQWNIPSNNFVYFETRSRETTFFYGIAKQPVWYTKTGQIRVKECS